MSDLKARLLAGTQVPLFDLRMEAHTAIEALEVRVAELEADRQAKLDEADLARAVSTALTLLPQAWFKGFDAAVAIFKGNEK